MINAVRLATVLSLLHSGKLSSSRITLETGAGIIPIEIDQSFGNPRVIMTQIAPDFGPKVDPANIAAIGGIDADDIIATPQIVSTGLPFCIAVVKSHDVLRRVTLQGVTEIGDTFSRLLMAPPSPTEDPFTGSATGAMAAYLWRYALIEDRNFIAEQGHWLGRPGQAQVQVLGAQKQIAGVRIAGTGHVLMSGALML